MRRRLGEAWSGAWSQAVLFDFGEEGEFARGWEEAGFYGVGG